MERREQYDPEDIESLLYERSFDDLLEEERAYVLRHLSGRAEYEAMRTLLLDLRADDAQAPPLEPLPIVRTNVMEAFRAQRQPQWRIWLNSIGGVLVPGELPRLWRPALAFASLALLVVVAVWFIRGNGLASGDALAELKQKEAPVQQAAEPETTVDTVTGNATSTGATTIGPVELAEVLDVDDAPAEAESMTDVHYAERAATAEMVAEPAEDLAEEKVAVTATVNVKQEADAVSFYTAAPAPGRVVQLEELARNQTVANTEVRVASTKSRAKMADTPSSGRSLAQDRELASLLAAGW
ncbi:MAG: hypothetical protein JNL52_06950 [Flavobacteriales bacterium]|nr:hypothetical protein [Flavobacteriales bacterium]